VWALLTERPSDATRGTAARTGLTLRVSGEQLFVEPRSGLTEPLREMIRANKATILRELEDEVGVTREARQAKVEQELWAHPERKRAFDVADAPLKAGPGDPVSVMLASATAHRSSAGSFTCRVSAGTLPPSLPSWHHRSGSCDRRPHRRPRLLAQGPRPLAVARVGSVMKSATEIGRATLERLAAQAAVNRAAGDVLRADVRAVFERHPEYTAKRIIRELPARSRGRSVRRVQEILKDLRAAVPFCR
jgi:hypothetical protein